MTDVCMNALITTPEGRSGTVYVCGGRGYVLCTVLAAVVCTHGAWALHVRPLHTYEGLQLR